MLVDSIYTGKKISAHYCYHLFKKNSRRKHNFGQHLHKHDCLIICGYMTDDLLLLEHRL